MHDFKHRQRLGPFCELAYALGDVWEANDWDEDEDAGEDGEPED